MPREVAYSAEKQSVSHYGEEEPPVPFDFFPGTWRELLGRSSIRQSYLSLLYTSFIMLIVYFTTIHLHPSSQEHSELIFTLLFIISVTLSPTEAYGT